MQTYNEGGHGYLIVWLLDLESLLVKTSEVAPKAFIPIQLAAEHVGNRLLVSVSPDEVEDEGFTQLYEGVDRRGFDLREPLSSRPLQGGGEGSTHDLIRHVVELHEIFICVKMI